MIRRIISSIIVAVVILLFFASSVPADMVYETPNPSSVQMETASKIYSAFKAIGWNDYQIAGMMGNMWVESRFDYTSVETIYTEPFSWGEAKQQAESVDFVWSKIPTFVAAYPNNTNVLRAGIGLIGWTDTADGATGNSDLRTYAESYGTTFYNSIDIQLQFLLDEENGDTARAKILRNWTEYTKYNTGSVEEATKWFCYYIEGLSDTNSNWYINARTQYAEYWYSQLRTFSYDSSYADSILSCTGTTSFDENEDWTGWDDEYNREMAMSCYSVTEWNDFMYGTNFMFFTDEDELAYAKVDEWGNELVDTDLTIAEYCREKYGNYSALVIATAYTLFQRGYGTVKREVDSADIACTVAYVGGFGAYTYNVDSRKESLDRVYQMIRAGFEYYNNYSRDDQAHIFINDAKLKVIIQGVIYGFDYITNTDEYTSKNAAAYAENNPLGKIKQEALGWNTFADDVASKYVTFEITEHVVEG